MIKINRRAIFRKSLWFVIIVSFLLTCKLFLDSLSKPTEGNIEVAQTDTVYSPPPATVTLSSKYVTLAYPSEFKITNDTKQNPPPGLKEYYLLHAPLRPHASSGQIALSIKDIPEGGLTEDSNYRHYAQNKAYTMATLRYHDESVVVFTAQAGEYQAIAFWAHQNLLAIVAATNLATTSETTQADVFHRVLDSISWN
jgi:hypothetical protein